MRQYRFRSVEGKDGRWRLRRARCAWTSYTTALPIPSLKSGRHTGRSKRVSATRTVHADQESFAGSGGTRATDAGGTPEYRIWFAGAGETEARVRACARQLGLTSEEVKFLGYVPHDRLPEIMSLVDFGLFPSSSEGFGIGAAECLAAGRPVLALQTDVMQEVVGPGQHMRAAPPVG